MDPVTHGILGAAIGYAVGGRKLGRHAAGLGALAGMTPDLDHFIRSEQDPLLYVQYHRYFTHALAFSFIGALLPMAPWLARQKFRAQFSRLWLCAWMAYLSHCLLDASTTWGTQLYWPFSNARAGWDLVAIVDPVFTLVLAGFLVHGLRRQSLRPVLLALTFACGYLCLGGVQRARAVNAQEQLASSRHHRIDRREVMPTLGNNVVWRSVYLANGKIYADRIRVGWFSRATVREGTSLPLTTEASLTPPEKAGNTEHRGFDRFAWFASGWLARSPSDPTVIGDMRYSRSTQAFDPVWGIRIEPTRVEWVSRERDRSLSLKELWQEIAGDDARYRMLALR